MSTQYLKNDQTFCKLSVNFCDRLQSNVTMITLPLEASRLAEKFKSDLDSVVVVKDTCEELIPEVGRDLVFLDEPKLLAAVAESLKKGGFLLVQSTSPIHPTEHQDNLWAVSQKTLGTKTLSLFRKVTPASPFEEHTFFMHLFSKFLALHASLKQT